MTSILEGKYDNRASPMPLGKTARAPAPEQSKQDAPKPPPPAEPKAWKSVLEVIRREIGDESFYTWFPLAVYCLGTTNGILELDVPTESFRTAYRESFKPLLLRATSAKKLNISVGVYARGGAT